MSYYNTTNIKERKLKYAWAKNATQDEVVLAVFVTNKTVVFTPHEIQSILREDYEKLYPITSVRRSINTLTERDALIKTTTKRKGPWGASNYCWKYKE